MYSDLLTISILILHDFHLRKNQFKLIKFLFNEDLILPQLLILKLTIEIVYSEKKLKLNWKN
jgi:hypothetical protein